MTLLTFREFLRMILDYVGMWEYSDSDISQHESSKSLVRLIGSSLPIKPCLRPVLNIPASTAEHCSDQPEGLAMVTEMTWSTEEDGQNDEGIESSEESLGEGVSEDGSVPDDPTAMAKISALELELAKLRSQLAQVIKHQESVTEEPVQSMEMPVAVSSASMPPPPPPPLPPPSTFAAPAINIAKLVQERRKERGAPVQGEGSSRSDKPDIGKVLKQLGSVKLRATERSPGGTPIRRQPLSDASDPASIIAQALRKKFANCQPRQMDDEESDENSSPIAVRQRAFKSPIRRRMSSPAKVPFGPHLLRHRTNQQAAVH